jgi:acyl carrier protein
MSKIERLVRAVVEEHTDKDFGLETEIAALGVDSLDFLLLVDDIEDRFGVKIPVTATEKFVKVGDVVTYLEGRETCLQR